MRFACAVAVAVLSLAAPVRTYAQTSLDAFGALPTNQLSSFGDSGVPFDFGGRVGFDVVPGVQVMGEFGRLGNVMPDLVATGLGFTGLDLKASAFYGEGGVRLLASPRSAVSPYVGGHRRCRPSPVRRQRVWIGHRCDRQSGAELCGHAAIRLSVAAAAS